MTRYQLNGLLNVGGSCVVPTVAHDYTDMFVVDKFGANPDIDTAAAEYIWQQGGTETFMSTAQTLYVSSTNGADDQDIYISGLDGNFDVQNATVTLNGTAQTAVSGTWLRVHRAYNNEATNDPFAGSVYIAESDTTTAGVPDTASKIHAKLLPTAQQTQKAIYTIPNGYTGYVLGVYGFLDKQGGSALVDLDLLYCNSGGPLRLRFEADFIGGTINYINHKFGVAKVVNQKSNVVLRCATNTNNIGVTAGFDILCIKNL